MTSIWNSQPSKLDTMKILVRPGSTIKEKTPSVIGFLNSLGAQATRHAEPQSREIVCGQISF